MTDVAVNQSVLAPAGGPAFLIHGLWLLMFWVCVAVFLVMLAVVAVAVVRGTRRRFTSSSSATALSPSSETTLSRGVASAVGLTVATLMILLVASISTGRAVGAPQASNAVSVEVIGHQWWWEIHYEDAVPSRHVVTANELHIPTNRPVVLKVTSRDVIHSFWVPNLQGKRDLIPGYTTAIWLQASHPGRFRGQCAEFCGMQHAHMALEVIAESDEDFQEWLDGMRQPARDPPDSISKAGRDVFMQARCAGCHTVRGSDAAGQVAPDLTHIARRHTLGAGTLTNTPEHMATWIRDPQAQKPGNQMPPNPVPADEVQALVAYLETLR
jgi:cytochrome c oxidase subunit 2